jgi:hypothetical protein
MTEQWRNLKSEDKVLVTNKSRLDHAFNGRTGKVIYYPTSNGFAKLHLDGDLPTQTVMVHPESCKLLRRKIKPHREWYSDFDSLEQAITNARKNNRAVYAHIGLKAYRVYPGGRNERKPQDDKAI